MRIPPSLAELKCLLAKRSEIFRRFDDRRWLISKYRAIHGKDLDTGNPRTLTEKLFCRIISVSQHGDPLLTRLADKFLARDYVRERVGNDHLVQLLWTGLDPTKIPFAELPSRCVIKTNHGSGMNIFLYDRCDRENIIQTMSRWLNTNYYWQDREYYYYNIRPRILIEALLDDGHKDGPLDYRFWCFGGQPEVVHVNNGRHSMNAFYDLSWRKLPIRYAPDRPDVDIPKPKNFDAMLGIASKLSSDLDFVRLDLYNIDGQIYFGEFTFFPLGGRLKFTSDQWDLDLGRKWVLPNRGAN